MLSRIFKYFASVRLAIPLLTVIVLTIGIGTLIDTRYGSAYSRLIVFNSIWFQFLLGVLWLNIFCATISRIPFKRHHLGFVMTHVGLLTLLIGVMLTAFFGIDGEISIREGNTSHSIQVDDLVLSFKSEDSSEIKKVYFPKFFSEQKASELDKYSKQIFPGLVIEEFLPFSQARHHFVIGAESDSGLGVRVTLKSSFFSVTEYLHSKSLSFVNLGPVKLHILDERSESHLDRLAERGHLIEIYQPTLASNELKIAFFMNGALLRSQDFHLGQIVSTPWMNMTVQLNELWPGCQMENNYHILEMQPGQGVPLAALKLQRLNQNSLWLREGSSQLIEAGGKKYLTYFGKDFVDLPFHIYLEKFIEENYPGTSKPMNFESIIRINDSPETLKIRMNEPIQIMGFSIYQTSYEKTNDKSTLVIHSVNKDPRRIWKYLGSFILFFGIITITITKSRISKKNSCSPS